MMNLRDTSLCGKLALMFILITPPLLISCTTEAKTKFPRFSLLDSKWLASSIIHTYWNIGCESRCRLSSCTLAIDFWQARLWGQRMSVAKFWYTLADEVWKADAALAGIIDNISDTWIVRDRCGNISSKNFLLPVAWPLNWNYGSVFFKSVLQWGLYYCPTSIIIIACSTSRLVHSLVVILLLKSKMKVYLSRPSNTLVRS